MQKFALWSSFLTALVAITAAVIATELWLHGYGSASAELLGLNSAELHISTFGLPIGISGDINLNSSSVHNTLR